MANVLANNPFSMRRGVNEDSSYSIYDMDDDLMLDTTGCTLINAGTANSARITAGKTYIAVFGDASAQYNYLNVYDSNNSIILRIGAGCGVAKFIAPDNTYSAQGQNDNVELFQL